MLAQVEAFAELPLARNINTVINHLPEMTDKRRTLLALSRVLLRAGQAASANVMMTHLRTLRLDRNEAKALNSLELRMRADFPDVTIPTGEGAGGAEAKDTAAVQTVPQSRLRIPSVPLPDDL